MGGVLVMAAQGKPASQLAEASNGGSRLEGPTFTYVALGDSTGVGYGARSGRGYVDRLYARLRERLSQARLRNLCVNGATSRDVLQRQIPEVAGRGQSGLVTLQVGVNDLGRQVTPAGFGDSYRKILKLLAETSAPVVVANLPDVSLAPVVPAYLRQEIANRVVAFNEQIAAAAQQHAAALVDLYTPSKKLIPRRADFFSPDGFHPSDAGYEFWADEMWPTVERALNKATPAKAKL